MATKLSEGPDPTTLAGKVVDPQSNTSHEDVVHARAKLDHEIEGLVARLSELRTQRNSLAPISSLGVELMGTVFDLVANDYSDLFCSDRIKMIKRLMTISRGWRYIALDTVALWTNVDMEDGDLWVKNCLGRQKDAQFRLRCGISDLSKRFVGPHLGRVHEMFVAPDHAQTQREREPGDAYVVDEPAPSLRDLQFRYVNFSKEVLFSGISPLLRSVILSRCWVDWNIFEKAVLNLPLTKLHIDNPDTEISHFRFLNLLQRFPMMEDLSVANAFIPPVDVLTSELSMMPVVLDSLLRLYVDEANPITISSFMKMIEPSPRAEITIDCVNNPRPPTTTLQEYRSSQSIISAFHRILRSPELLHVPRYVYSISFRQSWLLNYSTLPIDNNRINWSSSGTGRMVDDETASGDPCFDTSAIEIGAQSEFAQMTALKVTRILPKLHLQHLRWLKIAPFSLEHEYSSTDRLHFNLRPAKLMKHFDDMFGDLPELSSITFDFSNLRDSLVKLNEVNVFHVPSYEYEEAKTCDKKEEEEEEGDTSRIEEIRDEDEDTLLPSPDITSPSLTPPPLRFPALKTLTLIRFYESLPAPPDESDPPAAATATDDTPPPPAPVEKPPYPPPAPHLALTDYLVYRKRMGRPVEKLVIDDCAMRETRVRPFEEAVVAFVRGTDAELIKDPKVEAEQKQEEEAGANANANANTDAAEAGVGGEGETAATTDTTDTTATATAATTMATTTTETGGVDTDAATQQAQDDTQLTVPVSGDAEEPIQPHENSMGQTMAPAPVANAALSIEAVTGLEDSNLNSTAVPPQAPSLPPLPAGSSEQALVVEAAGHPTLNETGETQQKGDTDQNRLNEEDSDSFPASGLFISPLALTTSAPWRVPGKDTTFTARYEVEENNGSSSSSSSSPLHFNSSMLDSTPNATVLLMGLEP